MDKNILINGNTYNNISSIKVKDAETAELHTYRNTDDGDIDSSDVMIGKVGYNKDGKVIGAYIPPSTVVSGGTDYEDGINFYDQYGQKIASYRLEDLPLNALPEIPALEGVGADQYTFEWSMTLDEVNALTEDTDIGVDVTANEGAKTYLIPSARGYEKGYNTIYLYGGDTASTVLIDWGDGSTNTVSINANSSKYQNHTFTEISHNPISIEKVSGGDFYLGSGGSTNNYSSAFIQTDTSNRYYYTLSDRTIEVRVGAGVKGLSNYTFYRAGIEKIILPNNIVDVLGTQYIFESCRALKSLNLPKSVKTMSATLLTSATSLESLFLHEGLEISNYLASGAYALKKLILPKSYKGFTAGAVCSNCYKLKKLKFPQTLETVPTSFAGGNSFYSLNEMVVPKGITAIANSFCSQSYGLERISLPEGITTIGQSFASNCSNLRSIEIPEGVTTIGSSFAGNCYSLESVILPASLTSIGSQALTSPYSLKQIIMKGATPPALAGEIDNKFTKFKVYVPAGSLADYAAATNWTALAPYMEEY